MFRRLSEDIATIRERDPRGAQQVGSPHLLPRAACVVHPSRGERVLDGRLAVARSVAVALGTLPDRHRDMGSPAIAGVAAARTKSHRGVITAVPNELSLGFTR